MMVLGKEDDAAAEARRQVVVVGYASAMPATARGEVAPVPAAIIADARGAWPGVVVPDAEFARHLASHAAGDDPKARVSDLYLACACARGDAEAIATFERAFLGPLAAAIARRGVPADVGLEVTQILRARLLVGEGGRSPSIADYAGRCGLARWLRISAMREVTRLRGHERFHAGLRPDEPAPALTPEEVSIRARYGAVVNEAFRDAFRDLTTDDRLILRLHFAEGMNLDGIASTLGFSRATAGRRILAARTHLKDDVMRRIGERLEASLEEAESVLAALRSSLEITLGALVSAA